jgi:hypothetical protein
MANCMASSMDICWVWFISGFSWREFMVNKYPTGNQVIGLPTSHRADRCFSHSRRSDPDRLSESWSDRPPTLSSRDKSAFGPLGYPDAPRHCGYGSFGFGRRSLDGPGRRLLHRTRLDDAIARCCGPGASAGWRRVASDGHAGPSFSKLASTCSSQVSAFFSSLIALASGSLRVSSRRV